MSAARTMFLSACIHNRRGVAVTRLVSCRGPFAGARSHWGRALICLSLCGCNDIPLPPEGPRDGAADRAGESCMPDTFRYCTTGLPGRCGEGQMACLGTGLWGHCESLQAKAPREICSNDIDDDCDGQVPASDPDCVGADIGVRDGVSPDLGTPDGDVPRDVSIDRSDDDLNTPAADSASPPDRGPPMPDELGAPPEGPPPPQSCMLPNGQEVPDGSGWRLYSARRADDCLAVAEQRVCHNGVLSGSFQESNCTPYRYAYTAWTSAGCNVFSLEETKQRSCRRDDGQNVSCAKCGGLCLSNDPCTSCQSSSGGYNFAGAGCDSALATVRTNCANLGCTWSGATVCTVGGSPSCATCVGGQGTCVVP